MLAVHRAPMRSRSDAIPVDATHDRAFARGLVGFGDAAEDPRVDRRIERFADVVAGSFVWTREVDGPYRLGRIDGPYYRDDDADAIRVDLVHVRPCTWLADSLTEASVPAAVLATYGRGGRNLQQIHSRTVVVETELIWRRLS